MKAYSFDLRQKILQAYQNQESSQKDLAKKFKVSLSFINKLFKQYRKSRKKSEPKSLDFSIKNRKLAQKRAKLIELNRKKKQNRQIQYGQQIKKIEPNNLIFLDQIEMQNITLIESIFTESSHVNPIEYGWSKFKQYLRSVAAKSSEIWIILDRSLYY